jgi:hypothetical protein
MTDPSRDRQELRRLGDELLHLLEILRDQVPLWRGTLYRMRRKCGKESCHCGRGELHETLVLSDRTLDRPKTIVPPPVHEDRLREMTLAYQRVRQARARFVKLSRSALEIAHRLEEDGLKLGQKRIDRKDLLRKKSRPR